MGSNEENAAYVNALVTAALIRAMGMQAENKQREIQGQAMAFVESDFMAIINEYGLHPNIINGLLS